MIDRKSIVWLASYPKSGNTWLRVFLANYLLNRSQPISINEVMKIGTSDSIASHYLTLSKGKVDPSLGEDCIRWRQKVLEAIVANKADLNLIKTHSYFGTAFGQPLIPEKLTKAAIYIVRNPVDMVASFAKFYNCSIDSAIDKTALENLTIYGNERSTVQFVSSWVNHVESWTAPKSYPSCVIRYEDLHKDPHKEFSKVIETMGIPLDEDQLDKAVQFSSFNVVSQQEREFGFVENSGSGNQFFRQGKVGKGRAEIDQTQIDKIYHTNNAAMEKLGYL